MRKVEWRDTLWFKTAKNRDVSTGAHARLIAYSLAMLTHSLAPHYWLRTTCFAHALCCAHSFTRSLTHSRAHGKVNDSMSQNDLFLSNSEMEAGRESKDQRVVGKTRPKSREKQRHKTENKGERLKNQRARRRLSKDTQVKTLKILDAPVHYGSEQPRIRT